MKTAVLNFLVHRLEIYKGENDMYFESYATEQMINLLNDVGLDALKSSLNGAISSKDVPPVSKMFFIEHVHRINEM